jgi:TolB-like protein
VKFAKIILMIGIIWVQAYAVRVVAVLEIIPNANVEGLSIDEFRHLTDNLRVEATKALPSSEFSILTRDGIIALLPSDEKEAECLAQSCAVNIGRVIGAEYVSAGNISKFAGKLALTVELYETMSSRLVGSFSTEVEGVSDLLEVIRREGIPLFEKIKPAVAPPPTPPPTPPATPEPTPALTPTPLTPLPPTTPLTPIPLTPPTPAPTPLPEPAIPHSPPSAPQKNKTPFYAAVALDFLGVAAIGFGIWQNAEGKSLHKEYMALSGEDADYKGAGEKVRSAEKKRNIAYIVGGTLLAAGVGVHIWF